MNVRTGLAVGTRVTTRTALLTSVMNRFIAIAAPFGENSQFYLDRAGLMIDNKIVDHLEIVVFDRDIAVASVRLNFDWTRNRQIVLSYGDEVDVSHLSEGELFENTERAISLAHAYVQNVARACFAPRARIWWSHTDEAAQRLGGKDRINAILDVQTPTEAERADTAARWQKIDRELGRGRSRSITSSDMEEVSFTARSSI